MRTIFYAILLSALVTISVGVHVILGPTSAEEDFDVLYEASPDERLDVEFLAGTYKLALDPHPSVKHVSIMPHKSVRDKEYVTIVNRDQPHTFYSLMSLTVHNIHFQCAAPCLEIKMETNGYVNITNNSFDSTQE